MQCGQRCSFNATLDGEVIPMADVSGTRTAGCSDAVEEESSLERFTVTCCGDETRGFHANRSLSLTSFSGIVHSSSIRSTRLSCSGSRISVTATSRPMCFVRKCLRMLHLHGSVYGQCMHLHNGHFHKNVHRIYKSSPVGSVDILKYLTTFSPVNFKKNIPMQQSFFLLSYYYYYISLMAFFQDNLCKPAAER